MERCAAAAKLFVMKVLPTACLSEEQSKQQLEYECAVEDKEQLYVLRQVADYKMYVQTLPAQHMNKAGPSVDILAQV